jgi:uncharacterized protein YndB with AHSA1/START domain
MTDSRTLHIATPTDLEIVMTRVFDAPRALVFDALTRPDLLRQWLRAPGRSLDTCEIDLRVGGRYHFVWRGSGKKDVGTRGVYREIVPAERFVNSETWDDWDAGEIMVTTELVEKGGRTTMTSTSVYPSRDVRDAVLKSGLQPGAAENYDRLAELVESAIPSAAASSEPVDRLS